MGFGCRRGLLFFFSEKEKKQKKNQLRSFFLRQKERTKEKPADTQVG